MAHRHSSRVRHNRLTEKEAKELWRIRRNGPLMVDQSGDEKTYQLPSGLKIRKKTVEKLLRMEMLKSQEDGLFGDAQTYRAV